MRKPPITVSVKLGPAQKTRIPGMRNMIQRGFLAPGRNMQGGTTLGFAGVFGDFFSLGAQGEAATSFDWAAVVIAAVVGVPGLILAFLTYRDRWPKKRIEYLVLPGYSLLPDAVPDSLTVAHSGKPVNAPTLINIRIVNSGDAAIPAEDFAEDLTLTLEGVDEIAYATSTAARPPGMRPQVGHDGTTVTIAPLLLNSEDLIQLQVLTSGKPKTIKLEARITDVRVERIRELPYPPGSGTEGEMIGFDAFMWWVFAPSIGLLAGAAVVFSSGNSDLARLVAGAATVILVFWLYPLRVNQLIRRRRLWRPDELPQYARWKRFWGMR